MARKTTKKDVKKSEEPVKESTPTKINQYTNRSEAVVVKDWLHLHKSNVAKN